MRERVSMTPVRSITKRNCEEPLATVGKPYKLPGWSTVPGDFLTLNRTLCGSETGADSTRDYSVRSIRIGERDRRPCHLRNKFHISNSLRTFRRATYLVLAVWLGV